MRVNKTEREAERVKVIEHGNVAPKRLCVCSAVKCLYCRLEVKFNGFSH